MVERDGESLTKFDHPLWPQRILRVHGIGYKKVWVAQVYVGTNFLRRGRGPKYPDNRYAVW